MRRSNLCHPERSELASAVEGSHATLPRTSPTTPAHRAIPKKRHEAQRCTIHLGRSVAQRRLAPCPTLTLRNGKRRPRRPPCHLPRAATCRRTLPPLPLLPGHRPDAQPRRLTRRRGVAAPNPLNWLLAPRWCAALLHHDCHAP